MLEINNLEFFNFEAAFRGMRNPMNSWDKSDSDFSDPKNPQLGVNDLKLALALIKRGTEERKFLRQISVSMDILAPIYWWKEMDTYKVATVSNSTSTMHKLTSKAFEFSDFSIDSEFQKDEKIIELINYLEDLRALYNDTKDLKIWRKLIQLLPESYNQLRTWTANYETLLNIIRQRSSHKLTEWPEFVAKILELPYLQTFYEAG